MAQIDPSKIDFVKETLPPVNRQKPGKWDKVVQRLIDAHADDDDFVRLTHGFKDPKEARAAITSMEASAKKARTELEGHVRTVDGSTYVWVRVSAPA